MRQPLNAPVSVLWKYNHRTRALTIKKILFDGTVYPIVKIGVHYTERQSRTLRHVFCVAGESCFFKLVLDTDTLQWTCEEMRNHAYDLVDGAGV